MQQFPACPRFGAVYVAQGKAVKVMQAVHMMDLVEEVHVLERLASDHVVKLLDVGSLWGMPALLMENAGESLLAWLRRVDLPTRRYHAQFLAQQLARALFYIHSHDVIHCDLKPGNVMLDSSQEMKIRLCDFGCARWLQQWDCMARETEMPPDRVQANGLHICTMHYRSPEILLGWNHIDAKIDMWSAGCCMAELVSCNVGPMFLETTQWGVLQLISKALGSSECWRSMPLWRREFPFLVGQAAWWEQFGGLLIPVLRKLLHGDPSKRATAAELVSSEFGSLEDAYRFPIEKKRRLDIQTCLLPVETFALPASKAHLTCEANLLGLSMSMFEQDAVALLPAVFSSSEVEALTAAAAALTLKSQSLQLKSSSSETMKRIFAAANKLVPLLHQVYAGLVLPIVAGFLAVLGPESPAGQVRCKAKNSCVLCVCLQRGLQPGGILAGKWGDESGLQQSKIIKTQVWRQLGQAETARLRPLLQLVPMSAGSSLPLHVLFCKVVCWKVLLRIDVGKCCPARMMFSTVVHTEEGSGGCFSSTEDK